VEKCGPTHGGNCPKYTKVGPFLFLVWKGIFLDRYDPNEIPIGE